MRLPRQLALGWPFYVDDVGGPAAAARLLGVSVQQIRGWNRTRPPHHAVVALWLHTRWGLSEIDTYADNRVRVVLARAELAERQARELRDQVARLARLLAATDPAANDPVAIAS